MMKEDLIEKVTRHKGAKQESQPHEYTAEKHSRQREPKQQTPERLCLALSRNQETSVAGQKQASEGVPRGELR